MRLNEVDKLMFMKNEKRKSRHLLAIGVGAMAIYGAYSAVSCVKKKCKNMTKMLTNVVKRKKKCTCDDVGACENENA